MAEILRGQLTGRDIIAWILEAQAEDLPVMIRRDKNEPKEYVTEIKVSVVDEPDRNRRKYIMI